MNQDSFATKQKSINSLPVVKPANHAPYPKYEQVVADLFVPLEQIKRNRELRLTLKKSDVVDRYIRTYRQSVGEDILPVARLMLPKWDRVRVYMMKEWKLGRLVCDCLNLAKDSEDYKRIHNWKGLSLNRVQSAIQFSDILAETISARRIYRTLAEDEKLDVQQVNDILDKFHENAQDSKKAQLELMHLVIEKMRDNELRYFFRIMLKRDPVNSESLFLRCWHPDASRLFELTHDFEMVFWGLGDPQVRLTEKEKQVRLMMPFTPQRSKRVANNYEEIASIKFHGEPFFIEEKFDGERIQMHMKRVGDRFQFKYYTRNAMDYTSIYGEFSGKDATGCISPYITDTTFHQHLSSCILDGEMICWDPILQAPLPYSVLKSSALQMLAHGERDNKNPHPMFVAFDCLYMNDRSLENQPLSFRKNALTSVIPNPVRHILKVADVKEAHTGEEIEKEMNAAIGTDSEGIVLKDPKSTYVIASTNESWTKVKPEYLEEFGENLDLVIVGQIPAVKTSYLCALRDGDKFVTLCKISNGFSVDDYKYIDQTTAGKWKELAKAPPDETILFGKTLPVSWIDPKESIVIEARARSVVNQPEQKLYATDTTLYNAYSVKIRADKNWETIDTREKYEETSNKQKLRSEHTVFQRKEKRTYPSRKNAMIKRLNRGYLDETKPTNSLFAHYTISIMTDCTYQGIVRPIEELNELIRWYGARLARNPESVVLKGDEKLMVIAEKRTMEVTNLGDDYNVFRFKWCEDCIAAGDLIEPDSSHLFIAETSLKLKAAANLDDFGENPIVPLNTTTLWNIDKQEMGGVSDHADPDGLCGKCFLFYDMKFLILSNEPRQNDLLATKLTMNGATIVNDVSLATVIAVIDYNEQLQKQVKSIMAARAALGVIPRIVDGRYVDACLEEKTLVDPVKFKVPYRTPIN